ncbi:hypothetical protein ACVWZ8_001121 [Arthrobacter sp. UYCu723]
MRPVRAVFAPKTLARVMAADKGLARATAVVTSSESLAETSA